MKVCRVAETAAPEYPDRDEFRRCRQWFGIAVLGASVAMNACETPSRTGGVPPRRTSGAMRSTQTPFVMPPATGHPVTPGPVAAPPPHLLGVPPVR
jgi:hypothetical protein